MAERTLKSLRKRTIAGIDDSIQLTARSEVWQQRLKYLSGAQFGQKHQRRIVELAFLRTFLSWESFLEDAFLLYLLGFRAPSGYLPVRYATPATRKHAVALTSAESHYTDWTSPDKVSARAERFFRNGRPFADVIQSHMHFLQDLKTIRNAVTHHSAEAREKFKSFVRRQLNYYPSHMMTPGDFLATPMPNKTPPSTFLADYQERLMMLIEIIVPE